MNKFGGIKPIALFEDLEPTTDYQSTKEILDLRKVFEDFSSAAGMVNVEKIDQRRHFFCGSLSTLTSLFQRQRSTISVSLKLIVQKRHFFISIVVDLKLNYHFCNIYIYLVFI